LSNDERDEGSEPFEYDEHGIPILNVRARLGAVERKAAEAEARDENYKIRQGGINRWLMIFTGLLVLTSLISGGVAIWQARIANRSSKAAESAANTAKDTLKEIQKGGSDTHDLAVAAGKQADAARFIAENSRISATTAQRAFLASRPMIAVIIDIDRSKEMLRYHVVLDNGSTTIGADNLNGSCEVFIDDRRLPGEPNPAKAPLGPGEGLVLCGGTVSTPTLQRLDSKISTYDVYVHFTYEAATGSYNYCAKQRYVPEITRFANVGKCDASKPFPQ
jgi:hypothetical protein